MQKSNIVVVGSSNTDMVVRTEKMPQGGETVLGGDFVMVPGGKGANQAVCAAKLGANVDFVARIGTDVFGDTSLGNFKQVGVSAEFITRDNDSPSGVALIVVDSNAENAIVVAPGANSRLTPSDVDSAKEAIARADAVLLQFEVPLETVFHTIDLAHSLGVRTVLNPAPMLPVPGGVISKVNVLVLNQHEAAQMLGDANGSTLDAETAARKLIEMGVECVAITLGSEGAFVATKEQSAFVESMKVKAIDTTAAGDAFTASFACALAEGLNPTQAARFATRVAAISVTRIGAQPSLPTRDEVERFVFD